MLSLPNGSSGYSASEFGLSPEPTAASYQGTFTVGANAVTLTFNTVPGPSTMVMVAAAGLALLGAVRRRPG